MLEGTLKTVCRDRDPFKMILLFEEVRSREGSVADHLWVKVSRTHFRESRLNVGETVKFTGRVEPYTNKFNKVNYGIRNARILRVTR